MNFCGNSIKCQRPPQMAKVTKSRGPIQGFTVEMGAYSRDCSSRVGSYSRGGGGGQYEDLCYMTDW